jgi:putative SOS response-associated peptidase YedK
MCGRYALYADGEQLAWRFGLPVPHPVPPRYNIAPSQPLLALRHNPDTRQREWTHLVWGLVPRWAKDPTIGNRMINARAETLHEKPAFRDAYRYRRCIIPANGFYEWQKAGAAKRPYFVRGARRPAAGTGRAVGDLAQPRRERTAHLHDYHHRRERDRAPATRPYGGHPAARRLRAVA